MNSPTILGYNAVVSEEPVAYISLLPPNSVLLGLKETTISAVRSTNNPLFVISPFLKTQQGRCFPPLT
jgi:hypothetical protein